MLVINCGGLNKTSSHSPATNMPPHQQGAKQTKMIVVLSKFQSSITSHR